MTENLPTIDLNTSRAEGGDEELRIDPNSQSWRFVPRRFPRHIPLFIPGGQAYYWSREWQQGIRRSMTDLEAGNYTDYSPDEPGTITRRFVGEED